MSDMGTCMDGSKGSAQNTSDVLRKTGTRLTSTTRDTAYHRALLPYLNLDGTLPRSPLSTSASLYIASRVGLAAAARCDKAMLPLNNESNKTEARKFGTPAKFDGMITASAAASAAATPPAAGIGTPTSDNALCSEIPRENPLNKDTARGCTAEERVAAATGKAAESANAADRPASKKQISNHGAVIRASTLRLSPSPIICDPCDPDNQTFYFRQLFWWLGGPFF
ncbi:hypothetical protein VTG60DRAFT_817 [Thermothelomyces hinnuleus]